MAMTDKAKRGAIGNMRERTGAAPGVVIAVDGDRVTSKLRGLGSISEGMVDAVIAELESVVRQLRKGARGVVLH